MKIFFSYQHGSGQMRLRATTLSRRWVAGPGIKEVSIFVIEFSTFLGDSFSHVSVFEFPSFYLSMPLYISKNDTMFGCRSYVIVSNAKE